MSGAVLATIVALLVCLPAAPSEPGFAVADTSNVGVARLTAGLTPFTLGGAPIQRLQPDRQHSSTRILDARVSAELTIAFGPPVPDVDVVMDALDEQSEAKGHSRRVKLTFVNRSDDTLTLSASDQVWPAIRMHFGNAGIVDAFMLACESAHSSNQAPAERVPEPGMWSGKGCSIMAFALLVEEEDGAKSTVLGALFPPKGFLSGETVCTFSIERPGVALAVRLRGAEAELRPHIPSVFHWHAASRPGHDLAWAKDSFRAFRGAIPNAWDRLENADD